MSYFKYKKRVHLGESNGNGLMDKTCHGHIDSYSHVKYFTNIKIESETQNCK